jgi:hypothetical protein
VLVVVMARLARPWSPRFALPAAVAMAFGSLLLPFGTLLFSHTASAALVAGALLAWRRSPPTRRDLLVTGALLGAAVSVEYTGIVALGVVGLASILRDRWSARWVALGAAGPLAAVAAYHWIAFGGPLEVPYRYHNLGLHDSAAAGLTAPTPSRLWAMVSAERGLFALTPLILVALVGLVVAARDRPDRRWEIGVVAAVFAGFVIVQAGAADLTGGDSLGPRYVIPGLPALVIGLAALWSKVPRVCVAAALVSAVFMVLGTYTDPMVSVEGGGVVSHWLDLVSSGDVTDTLLDPLLGGAAIPVVLAGAAALVTVSLRVGAEDAVSRRRAARA